MKKIRLLLIEDNRLLRDGIAALVQWQQDIKVVGAFGETGTTQTSASDLTTTWTQSKKQSR